MEARKSSKVPLHLDFKRGRKEYFARTKIEAKLIFHMNVGELNLKMNRKKEAIAKYGETQCLVGICCGDDDLTHIMCCFGYQTKPPPVWTEDEMGRYLLELHLERLRRWKAPLVDTEFGLQGNKIAM